MTQVQTARFKDEMKRNITIQLGYANAMIFQCPQCPDPQCYQTKSSSRLESTFCLHCGAPMNLVRHVSFVDCPGHEDRIATMLNGAAVMDGALLIIAGNEKFPQPQTEEHLCALEKLKLRHIIILQNKIDIMKKLEAKQQYNDIQAYIETTFAAGSPIIPISAQLECNLDIISAYIVNKIPVPKRDLTSSPQMIIVRSFDVNKPGTYMREVKGGVLGGSIYQGVLKMGQKIEIRPGIHEKDWSGHVKCTPIFSKIVSLKSENTSIDLAISGGLIGVGTMLDPELIHNDNHDRLIGHTLGHPEKLPSIARVIEISFFLLRRSQKEKSEQGQEQTKVNKLSINENIMLNIGSMKRLARVITIKSDRVKLELEKWICSREGDQVAIFRSRSLSSVKLIGWGSILRNHY